VLPQVARVAGIGLRWVDFVQSGANYTDSKFSQSCGRIEYQVLGNWSEGFDPRCALKQNLHKGYRWNSGPMNWLKQK